MQPEAHEERKASAAEPAQTGEDVAFFPIAMPLTTGPGTIAVAVAVALASRAEQRRRHSSGFRRSECRRCLHRPGDLALLQIVLLCVGVQIMVTGVSGLLLPSLAFSR
jgi:multiple antibiotic resistance protein